MYGSRRYEARSDLDELLVWIRDATHDPQMNARLLIESLVDAVEALADLIPGPPK